MKSLPAGKKRVMFRSLRTNSGDKHLTPHVLDNSNPIFGITTEHVIIVTLGYLH